MSSVLTMSNMRLEVCKERDASKVELESDIG